MIKLKNFENINYFDCKNNWLKFVVNYRYKSEKMFDKIIGIPKKSFEY